MWLYVTVGGAAGALGRYWLVGWILYRIPIETCRWNTSDHCQLSGRDRLDGLARVPLSHEPREGARGHGVGGDEIQLARARATGEVSIL